MTDIFLDTKKQIESLGFNIIGHDFNRPWGGFLLIDESQSKEFISKFISNEELKIKKMAMMLAIVSKEYELACNSESSDNNIPYIRSCENDQRRNFISCLV